MKVHSFNHQCIGFELGARKRLWGTEWHCDLCRAFLPLSGLVVLCEHHKSLSILYCTHIYQSRMLEKLFKRLGEQARKQPRRKYQLNLASLWFGTCPRHTVCHPRKSRHHPFLSLSRSTRLSIEPSSIGGRSWPCFSWKRERSENAAVFCSVSSALGISPQPLGNQLTLWSMLQQTGGSSLVPTYTPRSPVRTWSLPALRASGPSESQQAVTQGLTMVLLLAFVVSRGIILESKSFFFFKSIGRFQ